jgi:hypothetical protein
MKLFQNAASALLNVPIREKYLVFFLLTGY